METTHLTKLQFLDRDESILPNCVGAQPHSLQKRDPQGPKVRKHFSYWVTRRRDQNWRFWNIENTAKVSIFQSGPEYSVLF